MPGNYHSPKDDLELARVSTVPAELRRLVHSPYPFVVEAVARNPHTEPEVLVGLLPESIRTDHEIYVAIALVQNPATPVALFRMLVERMLPLEPLQPRGDMRMRLVLLLSTTPRVPLEALGPLLDPRTAPKHLRRRIAHTTRRRDVLQWLAHDPAETVRRKAEKGLMVYWEIKDFGPPRTRRAKIL